MITNHLKLNIIYFRVIILEFQKHGFLKCEIFGQNLGFRNENLKILKINLIKPICREASFPVFARFRRHVILKYKLSHIYKMNYGVSFDFHEQMFKRINRVKRNHTNKGVIINTIAVSKIVGKFHLRLKISMQWYPLVKMISKLRCP